MRSMENLLYRLLPRNTQQAIHSTRNAKHQRDEPERIDRVGGGRSDGVEGELQSRCRDG